MGDACFEPGDPLFAMSLIHCIYASSASTGFHEADIPLVLERARARNLADGITGMLLFIEGSFFQVLEGEVGRVDAAYARIESDPRHCRVTRIIREPIAHRSFEDWSMGFASVQRPDLALLTAENDFFSSASCLERIDAGRAKKLLLAFGAGRWRTDKTGAFRHVRIA